MSWLWPRGLRGRLLLTVVVAVTLALAVAGVAFNLILGHVLSNDATDVARSRATAHLAGLDLVQGRVVRETPEAAMPGGPFWIFQGLRQIHPAPRELRALDPIVRHMVATRRTVMDVPGENVRLAAVPIAVDGRRVGTVVGLASLTPYDRTRQLALVASIGLVSGLLLLVLVATRWAIAGALRPVGRMAADAAEWSENDLDRRFGLGPPRDDLTRLAANLDALLDRLAASLRREQSLTAELSHELRTPLAKIITQAEATLRRERDASEYRARIEAMLGNARELGRTLEILLMAARYEANARRGEADVAVTTRVSLDECSSLAAERGIDLTFDTPPSPVQAGIDPAMLERILHPLVENACRYARTSARLSVAVDDGAVAVLIEDDGPGIASEEREQVFDPGVRGAAGRASGVEGAGLGLPLARRLARAAGGDVEAEPADSGARFRVSLPRARPAAARAAGPQPPA